MIAVKLMKKRLLTIIITIVLLAFSAVFFGCNKAINAEIVVYKSEVKEVNECLKNIRFREDLPYTTVKKTQRKNGCYQFRLETSAFMGDSGDGHLFTIEVFDRNNDKTEYADAVFDILYSADNREIRTEIFKNITVDYRVYETEVSDKTVIYNYYMAVITQTERIFISDLLITDGGLNVEDVLSDLFQREK